VPRDLCILKNRRSENKTTKKVNVSMHALWEFCYFLWGDLAETLLSRLHRRVKPFGELIGRLANVEVSNA
jgi:hypothetical protein